MSKFKKCDANFTEVKIFFHDFSKSLKKIPKDGTSAAFGCQKS